MRSTTNAIGVLDAEGKFIMVNQRACEITGYSQDELIGHMFSTALSPDDLPLVSERVMLTLTQGVPILEFETRLLRKDGLTRTIRFNLEPLTIRGSLRVAVGTAEDITERRQSEAALRKSEERFFKAFNAAPYPMIICRWRDGWYLYVNESFLEVTGYSREEVIGRQTLELGFFVDPADNTRLIRLLKDEERIYKQQVDVKLKNGGLRAVLLSAETIEADGERCILAFARDVTEHIQLEERVASEAARLGEPTEELRRPAARQFGAGRIVGESPRMQEALALATMACANRSASVLLLGESGTGKGLLAEEIHAASPRAAGPFVVVNCGALSSTLIEAELFGHEKGAFTGAIDRKKGIFEQAHQGTLLLDEIGELPLDLQVKLLRVVEKHVVRRVGGVIEIPVDVRIIAATNRDLEGAVRAGLFREDLYYRLNVIKIVIAPLRERVEDILPLAEHFLATVAKQAGKTISGMTREARALLCAHSWAGNVRELSNVIERAVVIEQGGEITANSLRFDRVPEKIAAGIQQEPSRAENASDLPVPAGAKFDELALKGKRDLLKRALSQSRGNKNQAATLLGISRFQLNRRIKSLGLVKWNEKEWGRRTRQRIEK